MGQNLRSVHNWRRAVELDPRDEHKLTSLAWQLAMIGEYDASKNALKRLIALAPDSPIGYRRLAYLPLWRDGDGAAVREELAAAPITVRAFAMEWLAAIYERDFNAAIAVLEEWPGDGVDTHLQFRTKSWFYGTTLKLSGDTVAAESYFLDANERVEHLLEKSPQDPRLLLALADIKANLGENRRAVALTNEVLNSMKVSDDASLNSQLRLTAIRATTAVTPFPTE